MQAKCPCVYMMANRRKGAIYVGVTSDPARRIFTHRDGSTNGFTKRYGCKLLVWYEVQADMTGAITREKQIKAGSRARKIGLIEALNPDWQDLFETLA